MYTAFGVAIISDRSQQAFPYNVVAFGKQDHFAKPFQKGARIKLIVQTQSQPDNIARDTPPVEVQPPAGSKKYWTRREIAEWLAETLSEDTSTLTGIDRGFSFPLRYFTEHGLPLDWRAFLEDFQHHWPTDDDHTYVDFVREGVCGNAPARSGNPRWRRVTEIRARGAKSVFHFDVQGSVAKSTHSGIPWLRYIDLIAAGSVHFWPFDGWEFSTGKICCCRGLPGPLEPEFSQGES